MDKRQESSGDKVGGYDFDFVDSIPERLTCSICTKVLRDPHLMICCGKKFCISCLEKSFKVSNSESCPYCRQPAKDAKPLHVLEKGLKSEIESCRIHCINKMQGCNWIGELRELECHLIKSTGCEYFEVECPNGCESREGKVELVLRKNLKEHLDSYCELRCVSCQYCSHIGTVKSSPDHKIVCKMFPVKCPSGCGECGIARHMLDRHKEVCPHEPVQCPNSCGETRILRMALGEHRQSCRLESIACPNNCRIKITRESVKSHRQVCKFESMRCPNGCTDAGIIRLTLQSHILSCPLEPVQCDYVAMGCKETVRRQDLEDHIRSDCMYRQVNCQYCTTTCIAKSMPEHEQVCELFPVKCPNGCKLSVIRHLMDFHRKECDFEFVNCKFAYVGCSATMMRMHMNKHKKEQTEEHMKLMTEALERATVEIERNKSKAHDYRQKLLEKDLMFQKTQAELEEKTAAQVKTASDLDKIRLMYENLKREVGQKEEVIKTEIQIYNSNNPPEPTPEYSYVRSQTRGPVDSSAMLRQSVNSYSYITEGQTCVNCKQRCLFFIRSIEAQFKKQPLSRKCLYLRMTGFNRTRANNKRTWTSPTFILEDKLEMYMEVGFQDQTFMNVRICIIPNICTDSSTIAEWKIIIELIEAEEAVKPQQESTEKVVMEVEARKLLALMHFNLKTLKCSGADWTKRFMRHDSILWAVTAVNQTSRP